MLCSKLSVNTLVNQIPQYGELFGKNLDQKLAVVHLLKRNLGERNKILKEKEWIQAANAKIGPGDHEDIYFYGLLYISLYWSELIYMYI